MINWILVTRGLIIISTLLFYFNSHICDIFYDPNYEVCIEKNGESFWVKPWWQLRFKLKSFLRVLILLIVFINVDIRTRIVLLPFICLVFMDAKDRIVFNYTEMDVWDVLISILLISLEIYLFKQNGNGRKQLDKNST